MAWTNVSATAIDIKKQPGVPHEGTYKGKRETTTKIGPQVIWEFVTEEGVAFGIYGFTNLNRAMEALHPGAIVKITYKGKENVQTKYGMKDVHQVAVELWEEDADPTLSKESLEFLGIPDKTKQ